MDNDDTAMDNGDETETITIEEKIKKSIRPYLVKGSSNYGYHTTHLTEQFNRTSLCKSMFTTYCRLCMIIGVGGIGSNVANILSQIKFVKKLILIDDDTVELSNLNRTPFTYCSIDEYKVEAMSSLICQRRTDLEVLPYPHRFDESLVDTLIEEDSGDDTSSIFYGSNELLVFDCRDDFYDDYKFLENLIKSKRINNYRIVRPAYDEYSITIDLNPYHRPVWGERGYSIEGSDSIPSQFVALLAVIGGLEKYSSPKNIHDSTKNPNFIEEPLTFNVSDIFDILIAGISVLFPSVEKADSEGGMPDIDDEEEIEEINMNETEEETQFRDLDDSPTDVNG